MLDLPVQASRSASALCLALSRYSVNVHICISGYTVVAKSQASKSKPESWDSGQILSCSISFILHICKMQMIAVLP